MAKRDFRVSRQESSDASYPTLDDFDADRRRFLGGLGAVLGAGALGAALAACDGTRRLSIHPDMGVSGGGSSPKVPIDAGVPVPDAEPDAERPAPDAEPDAEWPVPGEAPAPDARIDPDWGLDGDVAAPDARVDPAPDWGSDMMPGPGVAPQPDAAIDDSGRRPNP